MEKISFCVNTAKGELEYLKLLLTSMDRNFHTDGHQVTIFIDSDTEGTFDWLKNNKNKFNRIEIKLINNNSGYPVGYQANSNYMIEKSKHDIVSLVQSDMVLGKDFDLHMFNNLEDNSFLGGVRIEPPIHPDNPLEKYTQDFGSTAETFDFDSFNDFCEKNKKEEVGDFFTCPFFTHKKTWEKIGGFDTAFRWGKEDFDLQRRLNLSGVKLKAVWSALAYHFTCISSRGESWFDNTDKSNFVVQVQSTADIYETRKYIRRWRLMPGDDSNVRYKKTAVIDADILTTYQVLSNIEPFFDKIYINNQIIVDDLLYHQKDEHVHVNWRLGFENDGKDFWNNHYKYISIDNLTDKFKVNDNLVEGDANVVVKFPLSYVNNNNVGFFFGLDRLIDENPAGNYKFEKFEILIKNKINNIEDYIKVDNPVLDWEFEIG